VRAEFVAAREDVLDLDEAPDDPSRPKGNCAETRQHLLQETRVPRPARPGQPARYDYAYERTGTRNLFMLSAP
jgi:hypothetical protein